MQISARRPWRPRGGGASAALRSLSNLRALEILLLLREAAKRPQQVVLRDLRGATTSDHQRSAHTEPTLLSCQGLRSHNFFSQAANTSVANLTLIPSSALALRTLNSSQHTSDPPFSHSNRCAGTSLPHQRSAQQRPTLLSFPALLLSKQCTGATSPHTSGLTLIQRGALAQRPLTSGLTFAGWHDLKGRRGAAAQGITGATAQRTTV